MDGLRCDFWLASRIQVRDSRLSHPRTNWPAPTIPGVGLICVIPSLLKHRKRFHEYIPSPQSPVGPKADKPKKGTQLSQFSFAEASTSASSSSRQLIIHGHSQTPPATSRLDQNLKDPLKLVYPCFHSSMQEVIYLPIVLGCFEESNT